MAQRRSTRLLLALAALAVAIHAAEERPAHSMDGAVVDVAGGVESTTVTGSGEDDVPWRLPSSAYIFDRGDRAGAVLLDDVLAAAYCFHSNGSLTFAGSRRRPWHDERRKPGPKDFSVEEHKVLSKLLGLPPPATAVEDEDWLRVRLRVGRAGPGALEGIDAVKVSEAWVPDYVEALHKGEPTTRAAQSERAASHTLPDAAAVRTALERLDLFRVKNGSVLLDAAFLDQLSMQLPPLSRAVPFPGGADYAAVADLKHPYVAVHIRRGDVSPYAHPARYLPHQYFRGMVDLLRGMFPGIPVVILSQKDAWRPLRSPQHHHDADPGALEQDFADCRLLLDAPLDLTWRVVLAADVFVMSRSAFSYVPALFNPNMVLYHPFFHAKAGPWVEIDPNNDTETKRRINVRLTELQPFSPSFHHAPPSLLSASAPGRGSS